MLRRVHMSDGTNVVIDHVPETNSWRIQDGLTRSMTPNYAYFVTEYEPGKRACILRTPLDEDGQPLFDKTKCKSWYTSPVVDRIEDITI